MSGEGKDRAARLLAAFHEEAEAPPALDTVLLRRLLPYAKPHLPLFLAGFGLLPVAAGASLFFPLLVKRAIDAAVAHRPSSVLVGITGYFFLAVAVEFIARFAQVYTMQLGGQRAMADLRRAVFVHVQGLRVGYFDRTPIGRVVTRITNDIDTLAEIFASGAVTAVGDIFMLVGIVAFMLALDWRLSLVAFAALPPLAAVVEIFRRYARAAFRAIRARTAQLNAYLSEQVQGIAIVQAFGREAACAEDYDLINRAYRDANQRSIKFDALLYSTVESVAAACIALVLWYAGVRAGALADRTASLVYVGTVVAFYDYIQRFFVPIRDLSTKYTVVQQSLASAERIFSLLDVDEPDAPTVVEVPPLRAPVPSDVVVRFDEVRFEYRPGEPVLRGVSFDVKRGEKIAVVGATGAGKTTVTALLLRLYEVSGGAVLVDGRDVRSIERAELRRRFAVVPQDVFLFAGTVLENIAVGDPTPDEARARRALERVGASGLVDGREGGLAAHCQERGANFSAGERQLLAFARALYRDADLLVLDEATANVDSETEARLQTAVDEVLAGRTAIVIAHRLSTIRKADKILVFHRGEVVEQGTHEALLAQGGVYARLHELQFVAAVEPPADAPLTQA